MKALFNILLVLLILCVGASSQDLAKVDSLEIVLRKIDSDTVKVKILNDLFWELFLAQPDKAGSYAKDALEIAIKLKYPDYIADSYNSMGIIYAVKGDYAKALENYFNCLRVFEQNNDTLGIAATYNNIGLTYSNLHNYDVAIEYYTKTLAVYEATQDSNRIANSYNNIGLIYSYQSDTVSAFRYFRDGIRIKTKLGKISQTASGYENIAMLYTAVKVYDKAILNFRKALTINIESSNRVGMVYDLSGIGEAMVNQKLSLGFVYLDSSLIAAREMGMSREESEILKMLADGYELNENYNEALIHFKLYTEVKDDLYNADKSKDIGKLEAKHEFEKAEEDKKRLEEAQLAQAIQEEQRRNNLQYSGILVFLILLFIGVFIIGRFTLPIRLAEGIVFFSFLLLFEFTLVLLDPYIEQYSSGAPAIKLAFNAVLAALIFPLHSFFEGKLKQRAVRKRA